jgi:hypothetical protein
MILTIFSGVLLVCVVYFSFLKTYDNITTDAAERDLYLSAAWGIVCCAIVALILWQTYNWYDYLQYRQRKHIIVTMFLTLCFCVGIYIYLCTERNMHFFNNLGCILLIYLEWLFIRGTVPFMEESIISVLCMFASLL